MFSNIRLMSMGARIKKEREHRGFTQESLGAMLGITKTAVGQWERGITVPEISKLTKLAKIYDVSLDYLIAGEEHEGVVDMEVMSEAVKFVSGRFEKYDVDPKTYADILMSVYYDFLEDKSPPENKIRSIIKSLLKNK